jgi:fermentation-respiration switch protein FrsA (DUF1100 family)
VGHPANNHPHHKNSRRSKGWPYWRNLIVFKYFALLTCTVIVLIRLSYLGAQSYLQPPRSHHAQGEDPSIYGVPYKTITLTTQDGIRLAAWYTPPQNQALILVAHGYGGNRSAKHHALFARHGYGALSWDGRAHGESGGQVCTWGKREVMDVVAALEYAQKQAEVKYVGAYGQSMGAATVILAAAQREEIAAVIADSSYADIQDMLSVVVPFPPLRPLVKYFVEAETGLRASDLRPVEAIASIGPRPIFIIHGGADTTVPPGSASRLYHAAGEPRSLWIEPRAGHTATYNDHPGEYEEKVISFFDEHLGKE